MASTILPIIAGLTTADAENGIVSARREEVSKDRERRAHVAHVVPGVGDQEPRIGAGI
jgi:hypothetical protein